MMNQSRYSCTLFVAILFWLSCHSLPASAQVGEVRRPIDMMIVIDNSCSMFPEDLVPPRCDAWGNDPGFLRIVGSDLFIARLGFGEVNEGEYQAGVISIGQSPQLISPLQPLENARDSLAAAINDPDVEFATGIVPALKMAYKELRESPARKPGNLPAIVLISDGQPYPPEGQSNSEIEDLVTKNPDIPLFMMLLQNNEQRSDAYEEYIQFWEGMEIRHTHVFAYRITDPKGIEETYNSIVAQLQNTIPSEGIGVSPGQPLQVFVGRYVRRLVVTIIHDRDREKGIVTITDPLGNEVVSNENGVDHFRGEENPVEVYSIYGPRLRDALKEDFWTISSDASVIVFMDRQGAYRINFLEPQVSLTDISNIYLATEQHSPNREFVIRFNLVDDQGMVIQEAQVVQGTARLPDGEVTNMRIAADLSPDLTGVYEIRVDFAQLYPPIRSGIGRFTLILDVGSASDQGGPRIPVTSSRLIVDVGRGCYIDQIEPGNLLCRSGQATELTVTLGDADACVADSVSVRILGEGHESDFERLTRSTYTADLTELCEQVLSGLACGVQTNAVFRVRMTGQLVDGTGAPASERDVSVQIHAPTCTPTPLPTFTVTATPSVTPTSSPTPTPAATPCPDTDRDGLDDCTDECPHEKGIDALNGCPIPWWARLIGAILGIGLVAFLVLWGWPWLKVRTFDPPPDAYLEVDQGMGPKIIPLKAKAMSMRKSTLTVGGSNKDDIYVQGLRPGEIVLSASGERVLLENGEGQTRRSRPIRRSGPTSVDTSSKDVKIRIARKREEL